MVGLEDSVVVLVDDSVVVMLVVWLVLRVVVALLVCDVVRCGAMCFGVKAAM